MKPKIHLVTIELTNKCNLECKHCYLKSNNNGEHISIRTIKKIIKELKNIKPYMIGITGGEALLHPEYEKIIKLLSTLDSKLILQTNGLLLNNNQVMEKVNNLPIQLVQISLDGLKETNDEIRGKGVYENTFKILEKIKHKKGFLFTIAKNNHEDLMPLYEKVKHKIDAFSVERFIPMGRGSEKETMDKEELQKAYNYLKNNQVHCSDPLMVLVDEERRKKSRNNKNRIVGGCMAGISAISFGNDGTIYPCAKLRIVIGNINKDSLDEVWNESPVLKKLRKRDFKKCKHCKYVNMCGGCRAFAKAVTGNFLGEDTQCWN